MALKLKKQWRSLVNPINKEPKRGSVKVLSLTKLADICPIAHAWHKGKVLGEAYIDGEAQICVITPSCVEQFGLKLSRSLGFKIRLANHQKVKCLRIMKDLEVEMFDVKALVSFHVMPAGPGAYPIILGRPWLRALGAVQDWRKGEITLFNKYGKKKKFNMQNRKPMLSSDEENCEESEEESKNFS